MNFIERFLNIDLTEPPETVLKLFIKAIYQIRSEELMIDLDLLENQGDCEASDFIKRSSIQDICLHTDNVKLAEDVPFHVQQLLNTFNENQSGIVFRGTRLPLSISSFKNGYIHTTPQFATSAAYAVGISNSYGGIGRLLTNPNEQLGVGFIHAYEAPLTTKVYKNFQFENFLNGNVNDSSVTLNNLKEDLENFAKLEKDSFSVEYFSEKNLYGNPNTKINMSENMQKWYDFITSTKCMETPYYEVMVPDGLPSKFTFLINEKCQIIKLDLNNSKTKQVLQKMQNLLLKDFYEIVPLNKLVDELDLNISNIKEPNASNKIESDFFNLLKEESLKLNELKQSVIYKMKEVKQSPFISKSDIEHIMNQSRRVGSTNMIGEPTIESKVVHPIAIENFINSIHKKIKLIELPLKNFLSLEKEFLNFHTNNKSPNILDKLLDKIQGKVIPYNLRIKEVENKEVMIDLMISIEKKFNIKHIENPTLKDFVNILQEFKNKNSLREYCGKASLINIYQPMIDFISRRIIDKYVDVKKDNKTNVVVDDSKNITELNISIINMKNKFLNKLENLENLDKVLIHNNKQEKSKRRIE